jgi:hypothetical protein
MNTVAVTLEQLLPRLLAGIAEQSALDLGQHLDVHGPPPDLRRATPQALTALVEAAGLRGHGGAAFPVATKMRAVAARRGRAIVLANGAEGEPTSKKDRVLLRRLPHLVLDGAAVAARATGASEAIIAVPAGAEPTIRSLRFALIERHEARLRDDPAFELMEIGERYVAGQETALVNAVNGGPGKPTFTPPRPFESGVRRRPTLVQNVETLAHVALIARHGAEWFRRLGTLEHPGSALVTVSGAVAAPGVYEIEHGMPLAELVDLAGAEDQLRAVLAGGYFGTWISGADAANARLANEHLAHYGATLGAACSSPSARGRVRWPRRAGLPITSPRRAPASAGRACTASARSPTPCTSSRLEPPRPAPPAATSSAGCANYPGAAPASSRTARFASSPAPCAYSPRSSTTTLAAAPAPPAATVDCSPRRMSRCGPTVRWA